MKLLCVSCLLLSSVVTAQVPCDLPSPSGVFLNPTHVFASLRDLSLVDTFDVAYFDGVTLVQGPSAVPKTAWTSVAGECYKVALPAQIPAAGGPFTAAVRWRQGTTAGAWSAASNLFTGTTVPPPPPDPSVTVGPAELLYTNAQIPFESIDGTFATLKKDATSTYFFTKQWLTHLKFSGPLDQPLQTTEWSKTQDATWTMQGFAGQPWLMNIYQIDQSGKLLGFVHKEIIGTPGVTYTYAIGLGYSTNNGDSWKYLGDIVAAPSNMWNVAGVPYLVVGQYFYVYFNDFPDPYDSPYPWGPPNPHRKYLSVARALIADVLQAAATGSVTPWKKFSNGAWTQSGLGGLGSNIIADWNPTYTDWQQTYDLHSDAAYNTVLQKYLLTVQTHNQAELLLYLSDDGVNWGSRTVIDKSTSEYMQPFSTIIGMAGATADSREVGAEFYVLFPRKHIWATGGNYNDDDLYRRKITIGGQPPPPPPPPPPVGSDVFVSDLPWLSSVNGWGPAERDKSNGDLATGDGPPLKLKGIPYTKGIGTHANASIRVNLAGAYTAFVSDVGIDDAAGGGTVIFKVFADGAVIYDSGLMFKATATRHVNVSVVGKSELELRVDATSDGIGSDWGDWAGARLLGKVDTPPAPCTYVLTPSSFTLWSGGGSQTVTVTTGVGCPWTMSSSVPWIAVTSLMQAGPDDAFFVVAPNIDPLSRTGMVTIQGQPVTVTQEGVTCVDLAPTLAVENISPRSLAVGAEGYVAVRVASPDGRQIVRLTLDFLEDDGQPPIGPTGDAGMVTRFSFRPTKVGRFNAFVEAEDAAGCVTRTQFGPRINVVAVP